MKWIQVTSTVQGETLWINIERAISVERGRNDNYTDIKFSDGHSIQVVNPPDELISPG